MDIGCRVPDSHVGKRSRARAAKGLAATVQSRMAGANVAREIERAMRQCDETARTECRFNYNLLFRP